MYSASIFTSAVTALAVSLLRFRVKVTGGLRRSRVSSGISSSISTVCVLLYDLGVENSDVEEFKLCACAQHGRLGALNSMTASRQILQGHREFRGTYVPSKS
jgi:hypothetical protein